MWILTLDIVSEKFESFADAAASAKALLSEIGETCSLRQEEAPATWAIVARGRRVVGHIVEVK